MTSLAQNIRDLLNPTSPEGRYFEILLHMAEDKQAPLRVTALDVAIKATPQGNGVSTVGKTIEAAEAYLDFLAGLKKTSNG